MKIQISCTSTGIGDHVTAIYTACGYADAGHEVEFTTPYYKWLERVKHPNLTIVGEKYCPFSVYWRYAEELVAAQKGTCKSRADWYAQNLSEYYRIPFADPSLPKEILGPTKANHCDKPYVLIAPFSAGPSRAWEIDKWQFLTEELQAKGYEVIVVCSKKEQFDAVKYLSKLVKGRVYAGCSPDVVLDLVVHADHIVANDSSIAHLASLHRIPVTVICAHIKPEFVFGLGNQYVTTVHPDLVMYPCTWCCWTHDGGLRWGCHERCDALQSIEHEKVIQVMKLTDTALVV
jgi:Glycosyltransferase family 9 (heptosyltransferase)